jgi:uncharacterized repeat protein (TIGR03806 family)
VPAARWALPSQQRTLLIALLVALTVAMARPAAACVGDCDANGAVTVSELVLGVNIALGTAPLSRCVAFDGDSNEKVAIGELLRAVNNGQLGCVDAATPTPTVTPMPTGGVETRCTVPPGEGVNLDSTQPFCDLLSSYRFFKGDGSTQEPNDGVLPYDLNTPLFSDYALKHRFVWLPPGTSATYSPRDSFTFPVGAVIIKTFAYPVDYRDLALGERLIETRLLVRRATGWDPISYTWNEEQTEAQRRVIGASIPVSWIQGDGTEVSITYHVPNANQCKECHEEHNEVVSPLGPKARNLNKDYAYADGTANQLERWTEVGYLEGAPSANSAPRVPAFDDPSAGTAEARARAYLDVNCGHCHNPTGLARTSGLYLNITEMDPPRYGVCKPPVAAGHGSGDRKVDIVPGHPEESILTYRMESIEAGVAMPELGRQTVHTEAIDVINQWIAELPGDCD